jgi:ATP phosphoribosyltransferase regulatory subunit
MRNWLLPENLEDILPPQAQRIDGMRVRLLELFRVHGYELVIPPMLEYLESLLTGTGHDLDLRTFKLVDQLSGRMMGVRADITPQVARIDAHLLNRKGVTRLCYAGSVLLTRPRGLDSTREPLQIGAEIYGHSGIESDLEIQQLLAESLGACGVSGARLDIGHVAVFRAICRRGGVGAELESELYEALQGKDLPALRAATKSLTKTTRGALLALPELYGDGAVLERARRTLPRYPEVSRALRDLKTLSRGGRIPVSVDLADLRGYHYHSGVVFAAYAPGVANAIALGGRYDEVGRPSAVRARQRDSAWICAISRVLCPKARTPPRSELRTRATPLWRARSAGCATQGRSSSSGCPGTPPSRSCPSATASSRSAAASGS